MTDAPVDYRFATHPTWDSTCKVYAQTSIDPSVSIGARTTIWRYTTILEDTVIGADCVIGACCFIGRHVSIGAETRIHPGAAIPDGAAIGQRVFIGSNVSMTDVRYPNLRDKGQEDHRPPLIEDDVSVGCNAVLCPGVVLHRGCVIGAGAVVTRDVQAGITMAGNPARPLLKARRRLVLMNEAGEVLHG